MGPNQLCRLGRAVVVKTLGLYGQSFRNAFSELGSPLEEEVTVFGNTSA